MFDTLGPGDILLADRAYDSDALRAQRLGCTRGLGQHSRHAGPPDHQAKPEPALLRLSLRRKCQPGADVRQPC